MLSPPTEQEQTMATVDIVEYQDNPQRGELELAAMESGTASKASNGKAPDIKWSGLHFKAGKANILTDCWGIVKSKEVCAIMGPSGAGKSSLLNVLAGRSSPAPGITIEGKIEVNGKVINPVAYRKNIAYVMQDDALLATATPREALAFSAHLRLPSTFTREKISERVEKLLEELGLTSCAEVMIGGALIKGISGGQRKRTSVGVELITNPSLLFLDEPTSGLDSFSAFSLVTLLKKVATTDDCTILCTIHQPSSEVFFLFDKVIFLKDGRIFYQGFVNEAPGHFSKLGFECPTNYNPSDFIMNLCQTLSQQEVEEKQMVMNAPVELQDNQESVKFDQDIVFSIEAPFLKQFFALGHRELVNTSRDLGALGGRFGVTIMLNLLFGLIFKGAGNRDNGNPTDFSSHFGALTMVMISGMMGAAQPVMLNFPFERPMFLREYSTGTYGAPAYFLGKLVIEMPLLFTQNLVQYILVYFLMELQGSFIQLVVITFGLALASCSVAVALGCAVSDVKSTTELAPLLFVPQMLFVGFFIRTSQIPVFLRWAQYLCSLKYSMNLAIMTEFDLELESCRTSQAARDNCNGVIVSNNIETNKYYIYILVLFALFVGFRILGAVILVQKAKRFY